MIDLECQWIAIPLWLHMTFFAFVFYAGFNECPSQSWNFLFSAIIPIKNKDFRPMQLIWSTFLVRTMISCPSEKMRGVDS
jgi:hypothetical protein